MDFKSMQNSLRMETGNTCGWRVDVFGNIRDELNQPTGLKRVGGSGSSFFINSPGRISRGPLPLRTGIIRHR